MERIGVDKSEEIGQNRGHLCHLCPEPYRLRQGTTPHRRARSGVAIHFALPAFSGQPHSSRGLRSDRDCLISVTPRTAFLGSNSLRVARVLLPPNSSRRGARRSLCFFSLYRLVYCFYQGVRLLFSWFGVNWFYQFLSFYGLVVSLLSGAVFLLVWRSGFVRSRCCRPHRATQQVAQPDAASRVFIEVDSATFGVVYSLGFAGAG